MSATSQLLSDLAFDISSRKVKVWVITSRELYEHPHAELEKSEDIDGVCIHRVWSTQFGRDKLVGRSIDYLTFYISSIFALLRHTKGTDVVVAKTDPPLISVAVAFVARLKGALTVNWLQDLFPEIAQVLGFRLANGRIGALLRYLRNKSLIGAYKNVVLGNLMANRLLNMGIPEDTISVIHNWSDGDVVSPVAFEDNPLRKLWKLDSKFVVGYSGNLGRAHVIDSMLSAAQRLHTHPDIVFLFIGGGVQMQNLRSRAKSMGLDNIKFKPYQPREDLSQSLSVANVHLVTLGKELEGLIVPSKFYGILAAGRPTLFIGDTEGEVASIVKAEKVGAAVTDTDSEHLAQCLLDLKANPQQLDEMGARARQLFDTQFSKTKSIGDWAALLTNALDRASAGKKR